jgi:uncharacterized membrane protein YfhO
MRIRLEGAAAKPSYLLIGETWHPDWRADVDGKSAPVLRADDALLSVVLPPGARQVGLHFHSAQYDQGRVVTYLALLVATTLLVWPQVSRWRRVNA